MTAHERLQAEWDEVTYALGLSIDSQADSTRILSSAVLKESVRGTEEQIDRLLRVLDKTFQIGKAVPLHR